ncbi:MAG: energy-coupling factor transporter ATPase [Clostridia bacterium]|nr:energy-coupling factor transporter ATPase [Clostridia bacterium]
MSIISVKNLTYIYNEDMEDEVIALDNVSFDVEEGEFIALIGSNGSGKSTLARLLNGLREPTMGEVLVSGIPTTDSKRRFEVRKSVGVVFQNPDNQMVTTIIEDDVAFGPENLGLPSEEINARVDWALECVGMSGHRKGTPFRLSGGQKQRIAIAGVLAIKPKVLVLDESTAMLDPRGKKEVMDTIERIREKEGMTVIMITHFPEEASRADRVIALDKGKIVIDEPSHTALADVERLRSYGLDAPLPARVAYGLKQRGVELGEIVTARELAEALCRLK